MTKKKQIKFLDFDGVLAIPWTHPESYYDQIPALLKLEDPNTIFCCVSFNPRAKEVLQKWQLQHHFTAIRCGANHAWEGEYKEQYRVGMQKSKQIKDILQNELLFDLYDMQLSHYNAYEECYFYDDDIENCMEVQVNASTVIKEVFVVNNKEGYWGQHCSHVMLT